ncbi:glycosyltransferase family 2 protein [Sulfitobacter sp. M57]|uniref:glycosyltransferase family 2 protein n=1 Tax=unclassified Sulfitobacter TaxID=196795 RepID=UPI0023E1B7A4|nr:MULTISPECIES: glycosyltransferase family 2 protein [unclassified Sulfitobacter]MDF3413985.1 glycosyltransferase family 2 protein [Sulfitobacter sp. KE5]MDF3420734.1 glycosyltransferase family 2 protein [Sulfitobacter sp. KE43]MDF3432531.1 glycosyltransferase family 2 protein [Sulfitobacter sp. KE42]MDF3458170.1 glycosyltransferase family 2 protein [Sulfitobacter sp. S74]MDF3462071.1 glycosyltransferase family 2 protein [Sulfitobacter sp. Ks18]
MRITAVTCVKNEGPFLLEWIAFNRCIGVTDFLFYSNDCTDATDLLLDQLESHGLLAHLPNPATNRNYQMQALKAARRHPLVKQADWVWIADVDEFLNIHTGDHTIPDLIDACNNPQAISVTFQFMANNGVESYVDEPVITQFLNSHNPDIWGADTAIEVKSLVRRDFPTEYFGAHRPFHDDEKAKPAWTDGSGRQVPPPFRKAAGKRRIRAFPARDARHHATLNHYALRSLDSYLVKNDRGDVNREHRAFDDSYWRERNDPGYFDNSILRYETALRAEMARLMALEGVADLHARAVALHREKRDSLLAQESYQQMREQLRNASHLSDAEASILKELTGA